MSASKSSSKKDPLFGHKAGGEDPECKKCGLEVAAQVAAKATCAVGSIVPLAPHSLSEVSAEDMADFDAANAEIVDETGEDA